MRMQSFARWLEENLTQGNRARLITYLQSKASPLLAQEIKERLFDHQEDTGAMQDWPDYDLADAFDDVYSSAESWGDIFSRKVKKECEDILIVVGYYMPQSPGTQIMGGGRSLIRNKIKYDPVDYWDSWINK